MSRVKDSLVRGDLGAQVRALSPRHPAWLEIARRYGTPLYLVEEEILRTRARKFVAAFSTALEGAKVHYALKANPFPAIARCFVEEGLGLDASSGLELELALRLGCSRILLSGPGKTDPELELALAHPGRVTVLADSVRELERIHSLSKAKGRSSRVGLRISTTSQGQWNKFGVALETLPGIMALARDRWPDVRIRGLQFHQSWVRDAQAHTHTLKQVGAVLRDLPAQDRESLEFLDMGGGYYPANEEGIYPWLADAQDLVLPSAFPDFDQWWGQGQPFYFFRPCLPIEEMASRLGQVFKEEISSQVPLEPWLEPGRWLVNGAVQILLQVRDCKTEQAVIADAGTHLLGWERLEMEYAPLVNLSRPGEDQQRCTVYGSLCTPHDVWGYSYYGTGIQEGDILALLYQGAYVQTLQQRFIKPVAAAAMLCSDGSYELLSSRESFEDRFAGLGAPAALDPPICQA
ncbi:MAG: alanine racemase [Candidatus Omnitrophica bacterium]|nr:alanine racemase [Candidatus Omnitrophota bacterium]